MASSSEDSSRDSRAASSSAQLPPFPPAEASKPKVSSACDSCKRRKVKCTGSQPCSKCTTSGIICTYGSSAGRVRPSFTTAVSYTRHLEEKVAELQALLRQQPLMDADQHDDVYQSQEQARNKLLDMLTGPEDDHIFVTPASGSTSFHGRFAGLSVLRTVRDLCTEVAGPPDTPADLSGKALAEAFDSNMLDLPAYNQMAAFAILPSRERLQRTITIALDYVLNCKECLDRADLHRRIDGLYDRDPEDYTAQDRRLLGLIYALMALGRRHEPDDSQGTLESGGDMIILKGVTYFRAARAILDMSEVHDLDSIRTLMVLACYLLSSSMISKAYTYICSGVSAAMRLGLHVSSSSLRGRFSPAQLFERRQVFSVLNIMDTYVSSTLGMPNILRDADPDQTIPAPEEEMHDLGRSFAQREPLSPISETLLCAKLFQIQAQINQDHFPTSTAYAVNEQGKYNMDHERVVEFESILQKWHETLPEMSPSTVDPRAIRSQLLLRFSYTTVQIALYRPFLHHVIRDKRDPSFSYQGYSFASKCISASMQAVWLIDSFERHGILHEAQWFNIYHLALAASSLSLFVLGAKEGPTVEESRSAAVRASQLLKKLSKKNSSARRCYESLAALPQQFGAEGGETGENGDVAGLGALSPRTRFMIGIGALEGGSFGGKGKEAVTTSRDEGEEGEYRMSEEG